MTQTEFIQHQQAQSDRKTFIQLMSNLALPANNFPQDIREKAENTLRDLMKDISIEPKKTTIKPLV